MRVRSAILVAAALALSFGATRASFAQRGQRPTTGQIKSVDEGAKSFVISTGRGQRARDVTVKTDASTQFQGAQGAAAFADVKVGKYAVVTGEGTPDTGITAKQVRISDTAPPRATTGVVKSVDAAGHSFVITVMGRQGAEARDVTVKWTDKTTVMMGRQAAKADDIAVGKRVAVTGEGNPRTGITATQIRIVAAAPGANQ